MQSSPCCIGPTRSRGRSRTRCARPDIAYIVLGGVGFYERKEIKDALSYLKLILNPHDDVALRRVINVPARGIGKGVMDALEQVDAGRCPTTCRRSSPASSRPSRRTRCGRSSSPPSISACSRRGRWHRSPRFAI